jgi:hypothetical protein
MSGRVENMNNTINPNSIKQFRLAGDTISLEIIERIFKISRYTINKKFHGPDEHRYIEYLLTSNLFFGLDKINIVKETGIKLIEEINSICSFVKTGFKPISFDTIYIDQRGYCFVEEGLQTQDECSTIEGNKEVNIDAPEILNIAKLIENDNLLKNILMVLERKGWNWVNLYRVIEMLEGEKINIVKKGWITEKNYKRIKHTANSPEIIGEESRHGNQSGKPPKEPMPLNMAQALISGIIWNYINDSNKKQNKG